MAARCLNVDAVGPSCAMNERKDHRSQPSSREHTYCINVNVVGPHYAMRAEDHRKNTIQLICTKNKITYSIAILTVLSLNHHRWM